MRERLRKAAEISKPFFLSAPPQGNAVARLTFEKRSREQSRIRSFIWVAGVLGSN